MAHEPRVSRCRPPRASPLSDHPGEGGGCGWRSWHPSAESLGFLGVFLRVPSGTLWHPLADFGTLRNSRAPVFLAPFARLPDRTPVTLLRNPVDLVRFW